MELPSHFQLSRNNLRRCSYQVAFWAFFLFSIVFICRFFGPWALGGWNADTALPFFMINAPNLTTYHLFLFGTERIGGWPYIILQQMHVLFGIWWTVPAVAMLVMAFFVSASLILCKLAPGNPLLLLLLNFMLLTTNPRVYYGLFGAELVYHCQIFVCLWAFYELRRSIRYIAESPVITWKTSIYRWFLVLIPSWLAIWVSEISLGFLMIFFSCEMLLAWLRVRSKVAARPFTWRSAIYSALVFSSVLFCIRHIMIVIRKAHGRNPFPVVVADRTLDISQFLQMLPKMLTDYVESSAWYPTLFFGMLVLAAAIAAIFLPTRLWEHGKERCGKRFEDSLDSLVTATALSFCGMALIFLVTAARWWAMNAYEQRYVTISQYFIPMTCLITLKVAVDLLVTRLKLNAAIHVVVVAVTCVWMAGSFPAKLSGFDRAKSVAEALESVAGDQVLLGNYFGVHTFIPFQESRPMHPVSVSTGAQYTSWLNDEIRRHEEVVVSHAFYPESGSTDHPAAILFELGQVLRFERPLSIREFSIYKNLNLTGRPLEGLVGGSVAALCAGNVLSIKKKSGETLTLYLAVGGANGVDIVTDGKVVKTHSSVYVVQANSASTRLNISFRAPSADCEIVAAITDI